MDIEVSNNSKEIHVLRRWTVTSLFCFILSVHLIISPFLGNNNKSRHFTSISKLESMAFQAIELEKVKFSLNQGALIGQRGPASTDDLSSTQGNIGSDQNGNLYQYQIEREEKFLRVKVQLRNDASIQTEVLIPINN